MFHPTRVSRASGFTLVELLLVVAIVGMLCALLMPVFATVRERSRQSHCVSNLQQLGHSISLYAQDYDEKYPLGVISPNYINTDGGFNFKPDIHLESLPLLKDVLQPYVRGTRLWSCPSDTGSSREVLHVDMRTGKDVVEPPYPSAFERYGTSYDYHASLGLQQVIYPASAYTCSQPPQQIGPSEVGVLTDMNSRAHSGEGELDEPKQNVLFADGHVKSQKLVPFIVSWIRPLEPPTDNCENSPDD